MIHGRTSAIALALASLATHAAWADDVRYYNENGIRYQETTQVIQRPITETRLEPLETTGVSERYTTEMQESVRTYQVPVVEHQWVPGYQRSLNIFAPPTLSYRLMPVTRWETRTETVRIPVTKREYVPVKQVQQVPRTDTRIAEERVVRRVALGHVSGAGGAASMARNEPIGGGRLDSDQHDEPAERPIDRGR